MTATQDPEALSMTELPVDELLPLCKILSLRRSAA
jgi:hypothetical protein